MGYILVGYLRDQTNPNLPASTTDVYRCDECGSLVDKYFTDKHTKFHEVKH